jgi:hypothetical protein
VTHSKEQYSLYTKELKRTVQSIYESTQENSTIYIRRLSYYYFLFHGFLPIIFLFHEYVTIIFLFHGYLTIIFLFHGFLPIIFPFLGKNNSKITVK